MTVLDLPVSARPILAVDAILTGTAGLAVLGLAGAIGGLLGLPVVLLQAGGGVLVAYALAVGLSARPRVPPRAMVTVAIVGNLLWAVGCVAAMIAFADSLTGLGYAFLGAQIAFVLVFADLQFVGLRRQNAAAV